METTSIHFSTDTTVKEKSQAILANLGLDIPTALNLFLRQIVNGEAMPFEITKLDHSQNEELERIRKARQQFMGSMEGQIWMADDFDAPLEEMAEYM